MLPKMPVNVSFDPEQSETYRELWGIPAGRILMLLWRPVHIVSDRWPTSSLRIARRIQAAAPQKPAELLDCFRPSIDYLDWCPGDCESFCREAITYFTGQHGVHYQGKVVGFATIAGADLPQTHTV
jgi:hypothetical protein